jgi:hypothetical protein
MGVMIESNLEEGRQDIGPHGREGLLRGVSVTDGRHLAPFSRTTTDSPGQLASTGRPQSVYWTDLGKVLEGEGLIWHRRNLLNSRCNHIFTKRNSDAMNYRYDFGFENKIREYRGIEHHFRIRWRTIRGPPHAAHRRTPSHLNSTRRLHRVGPFLVIPTRASFRNIIA